ncbi:MAG: hypothetical protein LC644_05510 [Pseudonocardia sp.]|nr:hypothetical protein [Pseudonocardia sp.]
MQRADPLDRVGVPAQLRVDVRRRPLALAQVDGRKHARGTAEFVARCRMGFQKAACASDLRDRLRPPRHDPEPCPCGLLYLIFLHLVNLLLLLARSSASKDVELRV